MAGKYEHIDGCGCTMCRQIEQYRVGDADWACRVDCTCPKCNVVRALGDQREASKQSCACGCGGTKPSCAGSVLSAAASGATIGGAVCGPVCAALGAVAGGLLGSGDC